MESFSKNQDWIETGKNADGSIRGHWRMRFVYEPTKDEDELLRGPDDDTNDCWAREQEQEEKQA